MFEHITTTFQFNNSLDYKDILRTLSIAKMSSDGSILNKSKKLVVQLSKN